MADAGRLLCRMSLRLCGVICIIPDVAVFPVQRLNDIESSWSTAIASPCQGMGDWLQVGSVGRFPRRPGYLGIPGEG